MLIEVSNASFGYAGRAVVRVERLELHAGRCVGIFGPNGSGKTTLVRGIAGLLPPLTGAVRHHAENGGCPYFAATTVRALPGKTGTGTNLCARRGGGFGYLPQHRAMELHWPMSALDVACLASSARLRMGWIKPALARVRQETETLGVGELEQAQFSTLSGGQQQRVLLAGALAAAPAALVLDEPTDGLDVQSRRTLLDRLAAATRAGLCTILVSHEPRDLLALADEIVVVEPADAEDAPAVAAIVDHSHLAEHVMGRTP